MCHRRPTTINCWSRRRINILHQLCHHEIYRTKSIVLWRHWSQALAPNWKVCCWTRTRTAISIHEPMRMILSWMATAINSAMIHSLVLSHPSRLWANNCLLLMGMAMAMPTAMEMPIKMASRMVHWMAIALPSMAIAHHHYVRANSHFFMKHDFLMTKFIIFFHSGSTTKSGSSTSLDQRPCQWHHQWQPGSVRIDSVRCSIAAKPIRCEY